MPEETTRLKPHTIADTLKTRQGRTLGALVLDQVVNNLLDQLDSWEIPNPGDVPSVMEFDGSSGSSYSYAASSVAAMEASPRSARLSSGR
jgi:hypothetical protein